MGQISANDTLTTCRSRTFDCSFHPLNSPHILLRADPFERGDESILYNKWLADRMFVIVPAQAIAAQWIESFKEFPLRQKRASFNLDEVMRKMETVTSSAN